MRRTRRARWRGCATRGASARAATCSARSLVLARLWRTEGKGQVSFAGECGVDQGAAVGFADGIAERGDLDLESQRVAWADLLAEAAIVDAGEERQLARVRRVGHDEDSAGLGERF